MLVKKGGGFKGGEITPYDLYLNRRAFIAGGGRGPRARRRRGRGRRAEPAGPAAQGHPQPRATSLEDAPTGVL